MKPKVPAGFGSGYLRDFAGVSVSGRFMSFCGHLTPEGITSKFLQVEPGKSFSLFLSLFLPCNFFFSISIFFFEFFSFPSLPLFFFVGYLLFSWAWTVDDCVE
jgi:hypothetical protein